GAGTGVDATVVRRLSWQLERTSTQLLVAPPIVEAYAGRLSLRTVGAAPIVHVASRLHGGATRVLKSIAERSVATIALVFLAPFLLGIGLAIRLSTPGPALYRQTRVGRDGKEFTLLKFRTMIADADALRHELGHLNVRSEGLLL